MQTVRYASPSKSDRCIGICCTGLDPPLQQIFLVLVVAVEMDRTAYLKMRNYVNSVMLPQLKHIARIYSCNV